MNLPEYNGLQFKREIDNDPQLRAKSIPFVFFSTSADPQSINTAYKELTVQGYFQKPSGYEDLKMLIKVLIDYWRICKHPSI